MAVASCTGKAGKVIVVSPRVILREAISGLNGSDPVFINTFTCVDKYKYSVLFDLPASSRVNGLTRVVATGNVFCSSYDAEISAVQSVFMKLYKEYGYIIEDYSSIRGNICGLRYRDFIHKVDESKAKYEEIKDSYQNVMKQLSLASDMFASVACSPDHFEVNEDCASALMVCSEEFQRIQNVGMEQMHGLDMRVFLSCDAKNAPLLTCDPGDFSSSTAIVAEQVHGSVEIKDALRAILDEVAKALGFDKPVVRINGSHQSYNQVATVTIKRSDRDEVVVEGIGVSASRRRSQYNAICDALLLLETKFHVVIKDVNHSYYSTMFSRVKDMENSLDLIASNCNEVGRSLHRIISLVASNERNNYMLIHHPELGSACSKWFQMVKETLEKSQEVIESKIVEVAQNARIGTIKF